MSTETSCGSRWKLLLAITLPFFILDQVTKLWILRNVEYQSGFAVIPGFFDIVHVTNTGAAFGSFKNSNGFFIALSLLTLAVLTWFYFRGAFRSVFSRIGYTLLASGILGNVTDRLWHGHVIDFLQFDLHVPFANPWPSFNVADSCICIAAILFVISGKDEKEEDGAAKKTAE